jgi:LytS/YehU family sensor histidine kinase
LEDTRVPPELYKPFIEYSIIYGLTEKKSDGLLEISFKKELNTLICIIDDNGIGIKKKKEHGNKKSFGVKSAKDRVSLLKQIKKLEAQIEILEKKKESV